MTTTAAPALHPPEFEVIVSAEAIQERVRALGRQITAEYAGKEVILVGVLKGSLLFMADLAREVKLPLTCDFLRVASYEGMQSSGVVRFEFDLTQPIKDKHVLLVEDIVDTGLTMNFLMENLRLRLPASLKICALLDKPANRRSPVEIAYTGFSIEPRFVIGYGLDLEGKYRNLPYIAAKRD